MSEFIFDKAVKRKYKKKIKWSSIEEISLIEIWEEKIYDLRGQRKNSHIYEEMKKKLKKINNFDVSTEEIKIKIHNLTSKYRKEKANIGSSGGSPSEWTLYQKIHNILGNFKINNVESLVEESINYEQIQYNAESQMPIAGEIDKESNNSSFSLPDPKVSQPISSPSTSSSREPCKKKKKFNLKAEILKNFEKVEAEIVKQNKEMMQADEKMYKLEVHRTELLEKFVNNTSELKNAFISFLNSKKV